MAHCGMTKVANAHSAARRERTPSDSDTFAVSYARVSTEDQAREGFSLEAQQRRIRAYCSAKGYGLLRGYVDNGYSGRSTNRPGFQEMMDVVRNGLNADGRTVRISVVVVAKFDRLNRNLYDFLATLREMERNKVDFASVDETVDTRGPLGRFFMQMIAAIAELESGMIGERVRHGMTQKALKGGFNGMSAPYGYKVRAGRLVIIKREAAVVRRFCGWRRRGRSLRWIADRLNQDGIPTKKGKRWTKRQVHRIVHSPLYRGSLHWLDIVIPGTHPAIVTRTPRRKRRR